MRIDFTKMHGLGNDFILFDAPPGGPPSTAQLRRLADRRTGIGFDQALVFEPARRAGSSFSYRIFNADGGEVEQSGNGARCAAALWARRGRVRSGEPIVMDSAGGAVRARVLAPDLISVEMGVPSFDPRSLPFDAPSSAGEAAQLYALEARPCASAPSRSAIRTRCSRWIRSMRRRSSASGPRSSTIRASREE
jgi:diaminopimelate epimerase